MGKDLESTMKWKVDISQFKSAISEANRNIKLANSEFKKASAGMDDWTKSEEGLAAKMKQLNSVADAQQRKIDVLTEQYEQTAKAQGEDSKAAQELKTQLNYQEAALEATKKEMRKYSEGVDDAGEETQKTTKDFTAMKVAIGTLIADGIKKLISSLGKLKDAYDEYDAGLDTVITKTGATGDKLAELSDVYDSVQHSVLASSEDIGSAIGEINARFGYTGDELDELTQKFLKFAQINNTDVSSSVDAVQKSLAAFGMEGEDAGKVLDYLTLTAQRTGVPVDKLTDGLLKNATAFQEMGLSMEDSIALMGQVEMSGADMETVMNGVSKALKVATKEGVPLKDVLAEIEDEIKNGKDDAYALAVAYEYFGKSGDKIFNAIKGGTLTFKDFGGAAEDAEGAVEKTFAATMDGADEVKLMLQGAKADIGKAISTFLKDNKEAIKGFIDGIIRFVKNLITFVQTNGKAIVAVLATIASAIAVTFTVNKISAFTGAMKTLWSVMAAHPILAVTAVVGALTAAMVAAIPNIHDMMEETYGLTDAQKEYNDAIQAQNDAWQQTASARAEQISGIESETEYSQKLWNELQSIVDENGKVKEGYEDRAAVITGILSKALGIEIDLTNGQIQNYKELRTSVEDLIKVKKAEAYLSADETAYAEAVKGRKDAYEDLTQAQYNAKVAEDKMNAAKKEAARLDEEYAKAGKTQRRMMMDDMVEAHAKVEVLTEAYNEQNATLEAAENRYNGYMTTIQNHEGLLEAIATGDVDTMTEATIRMGEGFGTAETMTETALRKQEAYLKQKLAEEKADLEAGRNNATELTVKTYQDMYDETVKGLDKIEKEHATKARAIPHNVKTGIEDGAHEAVSAASWMVGQVQSELDSIDGYSSGSSTGSWFGQGLIDGINFKSGSLYATIAGLGSAMLSTMKRSLKEESPSKATMEMGEFLMEGLGIGIKQGSREVLSQADTFGSNLLASLKQNVSGSLAGLQTNANVNMAGATGQTVVFNQYNNSPKSLDALTIYRQTNSILFNAKVRTGNA